MVNPSTKMKPDGEEHKPAQTDLWFHAIWLGLALVAVMTAADISPAWLQGLLERRIGGSSDDA